MIQSRAVSGIFAMLYKCFAVMLQFCDIWVCMGTCIYYKQVSCSQCSPLFQTLNTCHKQQQSDTELLAQVMYAYVMRPETLPQSYWKFIVKSGPVEAPALEAVRRSIRGIPIDLKAFNAFLKKRGSPMLLSNALPKRVSALCVPEVCAQHCLLLELLPVSMSASALLIDLSEPSFANSKIGYSSVSKSDVNLDADTRCDAASSDSVSLQAQLQSTYGYVPQDFPPLHVTLSGALCGENPLMSGNS